ncbi:phosphotransferase enzyme family protein [Microbacterium radiodurans]|nr:phosphotransferase [Microbacterium radiodurans]
MQLDDAIRIARAALPHFGLDDAAPIAFVKYRENHVFRADDPAGPVAVRLHRPGYRDDDEVRTELEYLRALRAAGVPVPDVLTTTGGAPFVRLGHGETERLVSVQRWIRDAAPFGDIAPALSGEHDPEPEEFAAIGRLLGRLHAAGDVIGRPAAFRRGSWDAAGLAGPDPLWGDPSALASLTADEREIIADGARGLFARLRILASSAADYGIVHADATPENLLVTAGGLALIDFDDFGLGWFVFDLVTAIFHHARNPRYPDYERAIIEGYRSERPLSAVSLAAWDDFMLARGLTYLGWAAERPGDPASDFISAVVAPWVVEIADAARTDRPAPWRVPTSTRQTAWTETV